MPWPKEHKAQTRAKIVEKAAVAFRRAGVNGASVGDIMEDAGLTHGGFYAYFRSKDELLQQALAHADEQTRAYLGDALDSMIDRYLGAEHCAHPELGCPIAALGSEVTRAHPRVRKSFAEQVRRRIDRIAHRLPARLSERERQRKAIAMLATMIGGVTLARILEEPTDALSACREYLHEAD
jgi:TetR/AcrR family transcriptional repressor of nem operon